jgi:hypothetical protein
LHTRALGRILRLRHSMPPFVSLRHRAPFAACAFAAAIALALATACGPGTTTAAFEDAIDTLTIYALNGTPPSDPSALDMATGALVVPDGTCDFDYAFDINADNNAVIYPVRFVCTDLGAATRQVGLQRSSLAYDSVQYAPIHGYVFDSAMVLIPGQTMLLASLAPGCVTSADPAVYGKLVLDSINLQNRTIFARAAIDPNCGFQSLLPGFPTR